MRRNLPEQQVAGGESVVQVADDGSGDDDARGTGQTLDQTHADEHCRMRCDGAHSSFRYVHGQAGQEGAPSAEGVAERADLAVRVRPPIPLAGPTTAARISLLVATRSRQGRRGCCRRALGQQVADPDVGVSRMIEGAPVRVEVRAGTGRSGVVRLMRVRGED